MELFRAEALKAQTASFLGAIRIGRAPGFAAAALGALLLGALLVAFAAWGKVTRKATLPGVLVPKQGMLHIGAPRPVRVVEVRAAEGQRVAEGQLLLVLDVDVDVDGGSIGARIAESLAVRRATLDTELRLTGVQAQQRRSALADRLRSINTERRETDADADAAQRGTLLAAKAWDRVRELAQAGYVSAAHAQDREQAWMDAASRKRQAQRVAAALARDADAVRAEQSTIEAQMQAARAQLERAIAAVEQEQRENEARRRIVLAAPRDGTIGTFTVHPGQWVLPGQTLATVLPHEGGRASPLEAHLYAASRTAGFVQTGQRVRLRYDAYPYQKFGMAEGLIAALSHTPIAPQELPPGIPGGSDSLYRITVQLRRQSIDAYGRPHVLKAGMTLEADVLQDQRAIWEWFLEPLISMSVRIGTE
jgi:membrane fusion protein